MEDPVELEQRQVSSTSLSPVVDILNLAIKKFYEKMFSEEKYHRSQLYESPFRTKNIELIFKLWLFFINYSQKSQNLYCLLIPIGYHQN
jgi:hypothetical protein